MKAIIGRAAIAAASAIVLWTASAVAAPLGQQSGQQLRPQLRQPPVFPGREKEPPPRACFLLYDFSAGEVRRAPSSGCGRRVSPAATFEIAAAVAGLDAAVVRSNSSPGSGQDMDSALAYSSSGYFNELSQNLGPNRVAEYLRRFDYGNAATGAGGEYWKDGSLAISPDEQMRFLRRLFAEELTVSRKAMIEVRAPLRQPPGLIVGNFGAFPVGPISWRNDTSMLGKGGATIVDGEEGKEAVRWQVGHISRGNRQFVYVSCVTGPKTLPENAAALLAANSLNNANVF